MRHYFVYSKCFELLNVIFYNVIRTHINLIICDSHSLFSLFVQAVLSSLYFPFPFLCLCVLFCDTLRLNWAVYVTCAYNCLIEPGGLTVG